MKKDIQILVTSLVISLAVITNVYAEPKFIRLDEFLASRSDPADPSILYVVNVRCAVVYRLMARVAENAKSKEVATKLNSVAKKFLDSSDSSRLLAKLPEDRMLIDLKNYGNLYEELMLKNYAITGNYLDEPTLKSDFSLCQNLNS
jgi:hypothetical protein